MTAAGFLTLLAGLLILVIEEMSHEPRRWMKPAGALMFWAGAGLILAGVTVWLWRVMP